MLTTQGGMDIEQVAAETPDLLARLHVDPLIGSSRSTPAGCCSRAGLPAEQHAAGAPTSSPGRYRAFVETDAMLVEINPLIVTPEGELRALDSKYTVDDNALFRHPDIAEMRDLEALDPQERMARERGVTYVKLDGIDRDPRQRRRAGHVDARRGRPGRRQARPTSWTSAAERRPTRS